jgi:hypothetical protein
LSEFFCAMRAALGSIPLASVRRASSAFARKLQARLRIHAERESLLPSGVAVFQPPILAAARCNLEVQASAIEQPERLCARAGISDEDIGDWHVGAPLFLDSQMPPNVPL